MTKTCTGPCGLNKPITDFSLKYRGNGHSPTPHYLCKICRAIKHNAYCRTRQKRIRDAKPKLYKAPDGFRTCKTCKTDKIETSQFFPKSRHCKLGLGRSCKECKNKKIRDRRPKIEKRYVPENHKFCNKCKNDLPLESFRVERRGNRPYYICQKCERTRDRERRAKDPEKYRLRQQNRKLIEDKCVGSLKRPSKTRVWQLEMPEDSVIYSKEQTRIRNKNCPFNILKNSLRNRLRDVMKKNNFYGDPQMEVILGCSTLNLKLHLESLFKPGMHWQNHGIGGDKWQIDHIIPLASAEILETLYILSHYTNLQPLWQPENGFKSDKMPHELPDHLNCFI